MPVDEMEMPEDQRADLMRLEMAANEPDAAVQQMADQQAMAEVQHEQGLVEKNLKSLSMVFEMAPPVFSQFGFPTVAHALEAVDPDTELSAGRTLALAWAPVLAKYGVDVSVMGDKYKEEVMAVLMTFPIAKALYAAVVADTVGSRPKDINPRPQQPKEAAQGGHSTLGTVAP